MSAAKAFRLSGGVLDMIETLQKQRETTATAVVQQAIRTESMLQDAVNKGGKVMIKTREGTIRELVFMQMEG